MYAANLNPIELLLWGCVVRPVLHNYSETLQNLEKAIMQGAHTPNPRKNLPLSLHLQTVQTSSKAG